MVAKAETQGTWLDTLKLGVALALLAGGVFAFYWFGEISQLYRAVALIAVAVVALAVAYSSEPGHRAWSFMQNARIELRKVVWPTRTEAVQTTLIVLVVVVLVGIFLWLLDMLLSWGYGAITGVG